MRVAGGGREVALLERGRLGAGAIVEVVSLQAAGVDLHVSGLGHVLAAHLGAVVAAACDHDHQADHDRQRQPSGGDVAEDQPPARGGQLLLFGGQAFLAPALAFFLRSHEPDEASGESSAQIQAVAGAGSSA